MLALWLLGALTIFVVQVVGKRDVGQRHEALIFLLMAFCWPFLVVIFVLGLLQWLGSLAAGVRGDLSELERAFKFSGHSLRAGLASSAEVDER